MSPTTHLVLPIHDPTIIAARARAAKIYRDAESLNITDEGTKSVAVTLLAGIARVKAEAEARRVALVKPFNDHVKAINELFRDVLAPLVKADTLLRERERAWRREQTLLAAEAAAEAEAKRLQAEARLREAEKAEAEGHTEVAERLLEGAVDAEQGAKAAQTQAVLPARTVTTASGASTTTKRWTFRVVDGAKVSRFYLMLNEAMVRTAIRDGVREIEGLEIYQEETLSVRK